MNIFTSISLLLVSTAYATDLSFTEACGSNQIEQVQSQLRSGLFAAIRGNAGEVLNLLLPAIQPYVLADPALLQLAIECGSERVLQCLIKATPKLNNRVGLHLAELAVSSGFSFESVEALCYKDRNEHKFGRRSFGTEILLVKAAESGLLRLLFFLGEHWQPFQPNIEAIIAEGAEYNELTGRLIPNRSKSDNRRGEVTETPAFIIDEAMNAGISANRTETVLVLLSPMFTKFLTPIQTLFQHSRALTYLKRAGLSSEFTQLALQVIDMIDANNLQDLLQRPELADLAEVYIAKEMYFYLYFKHRAILPTEIRRHIVNLGMNHEEPDTN